MKKLFTKSLLSSTIAVLILAVSGCSDSDNSQKTPTEVEIITAKAVITLSSNYKQAVPFKGKAIPVSLSGTKSKVSNTDNLTYTWEIVSKPDSSNSALDFTDTDSVSFQADTMGDYVVKLTVSDTQYTNSAEFTFKASNPTPVVQTNEFINVGSSSAALGLDASETKRPAGGDEAIPLKYKWRIIEKTNVNVAKGETPATLDNADSAQPTLRLGSTKPGYAYKLGLIVSFDGFESPEKEVMVSVDQDNIPPIAKADLVTEAVVGQAVSLDASASFDPEDKALEYRWHFTDHFDTKSFYNFKVLEPGSKSTLSIPGKKLYLVAPELTSADTAKPSFVPTIPGRYALKLFVFDGQRKSKEKIVFVNVVADKNATNKPPQGDLVATGYYPSDSVGEQELGKRANFKFYGFDPEGEALSIVKAELFEKPANSKAELIKNPYDKSNLFYQIDKLDIKGIYKVRMTVTDGVNEITKEATMEAKIGGVNNRPKISWKGPLTVESKAVLIGEKLVFTATGQDKDKDAMSYEWKLVDKPNNSKATISSTANGNDARAEVQTDVAGVYRVRLKTKDDRGLEAEFASFEEGYAKASNKKPEILGAFWNRSWGRLDLGENYHQILPCMSVMLRPEAIDPDGDEIATDNELISAPAGGKFSSYSANCPGAKGTFFTTPGKYTFRYYATDILSDATPYDFTVVVADPAKATGVVLKNIRGNKAYLMQPMPYEYLPPRGYVWEKTMKPIKESKITWSLEAKDKDYTIENVKVEHLNGGLSDLTPKLKGLTDGMVIKKGQIQQFDAIFPAIPCLRTDDKKEGFHISFNIKEDPSLSFKYETWKGALHYMNEWKQCEPGQIK